jgi:UDP-N-acetylglucosamine acyltransferase
MTIHATAIIDPKAQLADDVKVGAYSVIGPNVEIDSGTEIGPHVVVEGPTQIGKNNKIFQFASIGAPPQDKKYNGEPTRLIIGDDNIIRESVTLNRGTVQDKACTTIGSDNLIMAYVHIAHDCEVGSHTVFANSSTLAGHVSIHDHVILAGFTLVHQHCRIGSYAFTGINTIVRQDVPPYITVAGSECKPTGLNSVGLRRHNFSPESMKLIKQAYKLLYRSGLPFEESVKEIKALDSENKDLNLFIDFLGSGTRGISR